MGTRSINWKRPLRAAGVCIVLCAGALHPAVAAPFLFSVEGDVTRVVGESVPLTDGETVTYTWEVDRDRPAQVSLYDWTLRQQGTGGDWVFNPECDYFYARCIASPMAAETSPSRDWWTWHDVSLGWQDPDGNMHLVSGRSLGEITRLTYTGDLPMERWTDAQAADFLLQQGAVRTKSDSGLGSLVQGIEVTGPHIACIQAPDARDGFLALLCTFGVVLFFYLRDPRRNAA